MDSPVSPIVANLCMEEIEKLAFCQTDTPPKKWFRFMDDVFSVIKKHAITNFHNLLHSIDPHINFTIEQEQNGQLSFLDTIVARNNGSLIVNVYRKPTHTDSYLDYSSHHDKQHKISTARTLLHRAAHFPNTNEGKQQEKHYVLDALRSNGYSKIFLDDTTTHVHDEVENRRARKTEFVPSPEELVRMHVFRTHVQYCQSDTGRESYSRPDKLLRTVNILYDPSLFVSAVGGRVKRLLNLQHMPTVRTVRTIRTDREPIHDPTNCYRP